DDLVAAPRDERQRPPVKVEGLILVAVDRLTGSEIGVVAVGAGLQESLVETQAPAGGHDSNEPWRPAPPANREAPLRVSPERMTSMPRRTSIPSASAT